MKKSILACFSVALLFLFCGCSGKSLDIKIPKDLINKQLASTFPVSKNQGLLNVEISNPLLELKGGENRLKIGADVKVSFFGIVPVHGKTIVDGSILYKPESGSFHFTDILVREFTIKELPEIDKNQLSTLVGSLILQTLGGLEVYKLDPNSTVESIAKLALKNVRVADDGIIVSLGSSK